MPTALKTPVVVNIATPRDWTRRYLVERGCRALRAGESASCVKILSLADLKVLLHLLGRRCRSLQ